MKNIAIACLAACLATPAALAQTGKFGEKPLDAAETGLFSGGTIAAQGFDFVQASTTTRSALQACPLVLNVPAIPPDATVFQILTFWNYLTDDTPASDTIMVNGNPSIGALIGSGDPDLCWGKAFGAMYVDTAGTGVVIGGANTIDLACDKTLGADPSALGEGITIVVVYSRPCRQNRVVSLLFGYASTQSSGTGEAVGQFALGAPFAGGDMHFMLNAMDGQVGADTFHINGTNVGGALAGTTSNADAWTGLAGPNPDNNLYDAADGDASPWVSVGDVLLDFKTVIGSDCVGHSVAWIAHDTGDCYSQTYCEPPSSPNNNAAIAVSACDLSPGTTVSLSGGPVNQFTYLLLGTENVIVTDPPGALGDLCVTGGDIRRYIADAGAIDGAGNFSTDISNSASGGPGFGIPGGGNIQAGDTFFFQYWHRDGMNPSRFSSAACVNFY